jgi:hypothetical protein
MISGLTPPARHLPVVGLRDGSIGARMSTSRTRSLLPFLVFLTLGRWSFGDIGPGIKAYDPRWAPVESAFQAAKETRDFSRVRSELLKLFSSPDQEEKDLELRWISYHKEDLTLGEMDDLDLLFLRANPDQAYSVKGTIALRHLDSAPTDERRALYLTAVRNGSVKLEAIQEIPRFVALGRAAAEGLEEFKPFVEQYATEIDRAYPQQGYRRSDELLWDLKLRAGAKDRTDALRLHARRLVEMDDERFAGLMRTDRAFRAAAEALLVQGCEMRLAEPCLDLARVTMRQERLKRARSGLEPESKAEATAEGNWLVSFREMTGAARVKITREAIETERRLPER